MRHFVTSPLDNSNMLRLKRPNRSGRDVGLPFAFRTSATTPDMERWRLHFMCRRTEWQPNPPKCPDLPTRATVVYTRRCFLPSKSANHYVQSRSVLQKLAAIANFCR